MATISCTVQRSSWYEVYLEYTYTQDKITAKTTVTHALKLKQLTSGYDFDTVASVTVGYTLAGTYFSKSGRINIDDKGNAGYIITLVSGTSTISHNGAGKGSFTVSVNTSIDSGGYGPGTITLSSKTVDLPDIPRASTIDSLTCSTTTLTGVLTYKYTPQNADFYNQCNISLNLNGTLVQIRTIALGKKSASQQSGTATLSESELNTIYNRLPTTTEGKMRFTFRTYSDANYSTQVGDASYKEITLFIPDDVVPTGTVSLIPVHTSNWVSSKGIYVAGYSSVKVFCIANGGTGATISQARLRYTAGGTTYQPAIDVTKSTTIAAKAGEMQFQLNLWDSRSRSSITDPQKIAVYSYSQPTITALRVERGTYDAGWTADDDGPDIRVVFKASLSLSAQGNVYDIAFKFNNSNKVPDYGAATGLESDTTYSAYFFDVDGESSYTLKTSATDKLGNVVSATTIIPTIGVTIEFNDSGKGIAFGKTSEKDAFECAWPAEFGGSVSIGGGSIKDVVVEQGTSGIWTYRKWNSGIAECWGRTSVDATVNIGWGPLYIARIAGISLPFTFANTPVCIPACTGGTTAMIANNGNATQTTTTPVILIRPLTTETTPYLIQFSVWGRWK